MVAIFALPRARRIFKLAAALTDVTFLLSSQRHEGLVAKLMNGYSHCGVSETALDQIIEKGVTQITERDSILDHKERNNIVSRG